MSDITLSKAVRSNLLSLQNTADMMSKTQGRLATGLKVNSALDNPTNFFTASSLNSRAGDINSLLDGMANGIQTLEAADNGLKAITKSLESMQSTLRQARQDKSFQTQSFEIGNIDTSAVQTLTFTGGQLGDSTVEIELNTVASGSAVAASLSGSVAIEDNAGAVAAFAGRADTDTLTITTDDGDAITVSLAEIKAQDDDGDITKAGITAAIAAKAGANSAFADFSAGFDGDDRLELGNASGVNFSVSGALASSLGIQAASLDGEPVTQEGVRPVDDLVKQINQDLAGKVRASNDNGKLRIENLSTDELTIEGLTNGRITGDSGEQKIEGNSVRADLANQFRELRDQLDKMADDASFNGINLLRGDNLQITFNEIGTSEINIRTKEGASINASTLGLETDLQASDLDSDENIDKLLGTVKEAINQVRSQASAFGSSLSVVQNRQDFSKNMINTLQTGAGNLTLADTNEEAANLLALQTRQQLSSTALSMASQADQAVLRLF